MSSGVRAGPKRPKSGVAMAMAMAMAIAMAMAMARGIPPFPKARTPNARTVTFFSDSLLDL